MTRYDMMLSNPPDPEWDNLTFAERSSIMADVQFQWDNLIMNILKSKNVLNRGDSE